MDTAKAAELLAAERARIEGQLARLGAEFAPGAPDGLANDTDYGDAAFDLQERERDSGRIEELRAELAAVERAEQPPGGGHLRPERRERRADLRRPAGRGSPRPSAPPRSSVASSGWAADRAVAEDAAEHEARSGEHERRALAHELRADDLAAAGRDREAMLEWERAAGERVLAQDERDLAERARRSDPGRIS